MASQTPPEPPKADAARELFFVYGTLRAGHAPPELAAWLGPLPRWPATLPGRLFDLGAYPAAVLAPTTASELRPEIVGELVALPRERIAELDRYEGYEPADPCRSLFVRERAEAATEAGERVACFVYVWAGGPLGPEVAGGDWLASRRRA